MIFPFGGLAMFHIIQVTEITILEVVASTIGIGVLLLGIIFALFAIGKYFFQERFRSY